MTSLVYYRRNGLIIIMASFLVLTCRYEQVKRPIGVSRTQIALSSSPPRLLCTTIIPGLGLGLGLGLGGYSMNLGILSEQV
jgi:hypothetical protein